MITTTEAFQKLNENLSQTEKDILKEMEKLIDEAILNHFNGSRVKIELKALFADYFYPSSTKESLARRNVLSQTKKLDSLYSLLIHRYASNGWVVDIQSEDTVPVYLVLQPELKINSMPSSFLSKMNAVTI